MEYAMLLFSYVKLMAWDATFVIPAVLIGRLLIGRVSKRLCYVLWAIVAVRLCCPVLPSSGISLFGLFPDGQTIQSTEASLPSPDAADAETVSPPFGGSDVKDPLRTDDRDAMGTASRTAAGDAMGTASRITDRDAMGTTSRTAAGSSADQQGVFARYAWLSRYITIADTRGWFCRIWLAGLAVMTGWSPGGQTEEKADEYSKSQHIGETDENGAKSVRDLFGGYQPRGRRRPVSRADPEQKL